MTSLSPLITGWLLEKAVFGWPLILAGALKALYDLVLYRRYARVAAGER